MFCPFICYEKLIAKILLENNLTISSAESCTGGLISSMLTDVSGSSAFIKLNFVTYANEAKEKCLNVLSETLVNYGAVSEQTAKEMAKGLLTKTKSDFALSVTGIAGPLGGSREKPVGLAYVGLAENLGKTVKVEKILMPKFLPRKFMKFCFARYALYFALKYIREVRKGS